MSQLTVYQRYTISEMLQKGFSQTAIAVVIGKHKSVLSREIQRNCDKRSGEYRYELAQKKCAERHHIKPKKLHYTDTIKAYVIEKLGSKYSPEQIVGQALKDGVDCVSHERIYQHIWADKHKKGTLYTHLRTRGKRYRKRGNSKDSRGIVKDRVDIDERPAVVEERQRIGDLEIDTIIGEHHKGAIVTINDRTTGMLKMELLQSKDAKELARVTIETLQEWKPYLHTITSDNGKEFAEHKTISKALDVAFFFAHPYHSWERGSNENLNGLIRQYIPKKTNFETLTKEYVKYVETELNNRPRKRHNFETPNYIFNQKKVAFIT